MGRVKDFILSPQRALYNFDYDRSHKDINSSHPDRSRYIVGAVATTLVAGLVLAPDLLAEKPSITDLVEPGHPVMADVENLPQSE